MSVYRKTRLLLIKIFILSLILFISNSCNNSNQEKLFKEKYGGVFFFSISDPVTSLDPNQIIYVSDWEVASIIYEGLVGYGSDFETIEPLIAESWKISDGGKEYTFNIRRGIKFHDDVCFKEGKGRELTAYDIRYNFLRICSSLNPGSNAGLYLSKIEGAKEYNESKTSEISGISIVDSFTVKIRLKKPSASFLKILASQSAYIIPKEAVEYYRDSFKNHPVGSGPFRLAQWKELQEITLVRNDNYWKKDLAGNKLPYLNKIKITLGNSQEIVFNEFVKGNSYFLTSDIAAFNTLKQRSEFSKQFNYEEVSKGMTSRFFGFSMNKNYELARNKNLRKAIAFAFNRSKVLKEELNAVPAYSLVPAYLFKKQNLFKDPYNMDVAKELAGKSGFSGTVSISSPLKMSDVEELRECIVALGLKAKVNSDAVNYYNHIVEDRPDIFRVSMHPSYPDPEEYYQLFYSGSGKEINLTGFSNQMFDQIFEKAIVELDNNKRELLFIELEKILSEEMPAIFISHNKTIYYIYPNFVNDLRIRYTIPDFRYVWLKKDKQNN